MNKNIKILEIWREIPAVVKNQRLTTLKKFKKIVYDNSDTTQKKLGKLYIGASQPEVCKAMKKIGYTYKKRVSDYQEKDETKRK